MGSVGKLKPFNEKEDDWASYVEQLEMYFMANDVKAEKKVAVLISSMSASTYGLLRSLLSPVKPSTLTFKELCETLQKHLSPAPITIAERFRFYKRDQRDGETVNEYIAELKKMSSKCEFGQFLEEALRDKLVCGLRNTVIQEQLLTVDKLTFEDATQKALMMEQATADVKELHVQEQRGVNVMQQEQANRKQSHNCKYCGKRHPGECWHKDAICNKCGEKGHIQRNCTNTAKVKPKDRRCKDDNKKPSTKSKRHLHKMEEATSREELDSSSEEEYDCNALRIHRNSSKRESETESIMLDVRLNGKQLQMELDTGSAVSILSYDDAKELFQSVKLRDTDVILKTYTGERIKPRGIMDVRVEYGDQCSTLPLLIVQGDGPALFGRDWLKHIQLNWQEIKLHYTKAHDSEKKLKSIIDKHEILFEAELGTMKHVKARIVVKQTAVPKFCKARPIAYALEPKIEEEVDRLVKDGVLSPVSFSEWATAIVPVVKQDGSIRLCGDFKTTINPQLEADQHPIPKVEDILARVNGGEKFSKIDLAQAYLQMEVEEDDKKFLTINTPKGLFRYNRLPFGIASAPAQFQRAMEQVLIGCKGTQVYFDDVLVTGKDDEEHLENLDKVLERLETHGLKLKRAKCEFMKTSLNYLGHKIDKQGLHTDDNKVAAIRNAPAPTNTKELRSVLGLINYYNRFIPRSATLLQPLNKLLRKGVKWQWGTECQQALDEVKRIISSSEVLVHYSTEKPLVLATDASAHGVGAVLSHILESGEERPIAFASRSLTPAERNYAQIDREALGIMFGLKRFHQYLYGRKWKLITDHEPLTSILHPKKGIPSMTIARLQRWAIILSAYDYDIEYRNTSKHGNADFVSRCPVPSNRANKHDSFDVYMMSNIERMPVTDSDVRRETRNDPLLGKVVSMLQMNRWLTDDPDIAPFVTRRNELSLWNGCIMWGSRVVMPTKLQPVILEELHAAHLGIVKMKAIARSFVWWPKMDKAIENVAASCESCQVAAVAPAKASVHPWLLPAGPWQRVHIDFAGPYMGNMFLVVCDAYSKWPEVKIMNTTTTTATIDALYEIFSRLGLPDHIHSDNGPQFVSEEFKNFMKLNGILHTKSAPYHPSSNGLAERFVQTLKRALKSEKKFNLQRRLARFLFDYRNAPSASTGMAPAELMLGRTLKSRLHLLKPQLMATQQKQHVKYESDEPSRRLEVDEKVWVRNYAMGEKWVKGTITGKQGKVMYDVLLKDGQVARRHIDQLRSLHELPAKSSIPIVVPKPHVPEVIQDTRDKVPGDTPLPTQTSPEVQTASPSQAELPPVAQPQPTTPVPRYPKREHRRAPDRLSYS